MRDVDGGEDAGARAGVPHELLVDAEAEAPCDRLLARVAGDQAPARQRRAHPRKRIEIRHFVRRVHMNETQFSTRGQRNAQRMGEGVLRPGKARGMKNGTENVRHVPWLEDNDASCPKHARVAAGLQAIPRGDAKSEVLPLRARQLR